MSISTMLIGIIRNSLFVRRDNGYPENEAPDTVNTLEDIVRQVKEDAAESPQMLEAKEFFSPTHVMLSKASSARAAPVNPGALAGSRIAKAKKHIRLTADQYEELIEKDLTVLEIVGQVIERNVAARSQLMASPA